jgi:WD40 repeat protein
MANLRKLWNLHSGQLVGRLTGHSASIFSIEYTLDDRHLVSGSEDKTVRVWDTHSIGNHIVLPVGEGCVTVSSGDSLIFTGTLSGELLCWNINLGDETINPTPNRILAHDDSVFSVQYLPKIGSIITASRDRSVKLWSLETVEQSEAPAKAQVSFLGHKVGTHQPFSECRR